MIFYKLLYIVASFFVGGGLFALLRKRIPKPLAVVLALIFPWILFVVGVFLAALKGGDVALPYAALIVALDSLYCVFGAILGVAIIHQFVGSAPGEPSPKQ